MGFDFNTLSSLINMNMLQHIIIMTFLATNLSRTHAARPQAILATR